MPLDPPVPAEFLAQYDEARARVLRRRAILYGLVILALVAISWGQTIAEIHAGTAFSGGDSVSSAEVLTDVLFTIIFGSATLYFAARPRSRPEIVRTFQWVVAVAGLTAIAVTPLVMNASWIPGATLDRTPESDLRQGIASLTTVFLLHALASVFVSLSAREGLAPLIPVLAAFGAWVVFVSVGSLAQRALLILASPLAGLPGLAWSWWRYRSFNERFHARAVQKRYAEVSQELTDARRVHEALFPPPLTRGPIHVTYRYEPMREIGGDFLFVRPLAFPPSSPPGPVLVVVIDVTGHGIAAALAVNRLHATLERLTGADELPEPAALLTAVNGFAETALAPQGIFATGFCVRVEPPGATGSRLLWAGAGHPAGLLRTPAGETRRLDSTAPMLGILDVELFTCTQGETTLAPDEALIVYTDGAFEAKNKQGEQLGVERLEAAVRSAESPIPESIARTVRDHSHGNAADDMLVVEVRLAARA